MYGVFLQLALLPSVPNRTILSGFSLLSLSWLITWLLMVSSSNVVTACQHLSWGVWRLGRQCFGCTWLVYTRSLLAWARFLWIDTFLFLLGEILLSYPSLNSVTMKVRNYLLLWLDCLLWWNIHDTRCVEFGGFQFVHIAMQPSPFSERFHHPKQKLSVQFSCSVVSASLRPHEPHHARPPCPSPTPGVHPNPC